MKKLGALLLFVCLFPLATEAYVLTFECKSVEVPGVHSFDAKGVVNIDGDSRVEGYISLQTKKAQAEGSIQIFENMKIEGLHQKIENKLNKKGYVAADFDQLILTTNESYIRSMSLLLDINQSFASQIFSVDNFLYRSNCFSTIESK